jgi:periplasmic protein TonB
MRRFAVLSLGLHVALLVALLAWFGRGPPVMDVPDRRGAVELVLVEHEGSGPPAAPPEPAPDVAASTPAEEPAQPPPPSPPQPAETAETEEALPLPPPPPPPAPSPQPARPSTAPSPAAPPVRQAMRAPEINLGGTDSETNAIVRGPSVIPARVDAMFRNKEPVYPPEAVRRAEQGAVMLLIHVSPEGLASGVDVLKSSGYRSLDRAARDAVTAWHFLPAVKDGEPIPFDMALRVNFQLE